MANRETIPVPAPTPSDLGPPMSAGAALAMALWGDDEAITMVRPIERDLSWMRDEEEAS